MSDLSATNCGCNNGYNTASNNGCCSGNNWIWVILLVLLFSGNNNGISLANNNGCGCGSSNSSCDWLIWILLLSTFCGGGCGCNN